ncbi:CPBP family intramembrane glutamic endopeptidase [Actinoplanes sp. CA-252034]|uniref:CPBP family intramembrane glutamic endopeptidase n=1 Tax=Actinoplanes sp. CA-252034 TaxID=3239906 RepID=UPI003D995AD5
METVRALVRRYPVLTFFALAFGLSWAAWTPYVLGNTGLDWEPEFQLPTGAAGQVVGMLPGAYLGPLGAAFIVTSLVEGRAGLRQWAQRLVRWRVGWRWYVAILLLVPATIMLATLPVPGALAGLSVPGWQILVAFLPMLGVQLITTAAAEEPGWRDFALPRLQERYGPLPGTVILGFLWGCWHLPLFLTEWGGTNKSWTHPVLFVLCCIPLSIVMTWIFNRTGQSLPIVMFFHAAINTTYTLVWAEVFTTLDGGDANLVNLIGAGAAAALLLVVTGGRLGLRTPPHQPVLPEVDSARAA